MGQFPELNELQQQAVNHRQGHLIIVAGPGTGKTHTITRRIIQSFSLLKENQKVLAITFTHKAANEMKHRLQSQFPDYGSRSFVATFHRFALSLLREFSQYSPLPVDFQIALPQDIQGFLSEIFPGHTANQANEILEKISWTKSTQLVVDPDEHGQRYRRFLRSKGLVDFDDIVREAVMLLENEHVANLIRQRYRYVFVDEYQDINLIQHALLKALVQQKVELTAIGDPHQSIYGFRGSDLSLFNRFEQDFPPATKMFLTQNYRSKANLLEASSQVIQKGAQPVPGVVAKIYEQGRLVIHEAATDRSEAEYVAHQIEQLVGGISMFSQDSHRVASYRQAQKSFGDFAILYRLNAQKNVIVEALEHLGIPYKISSKPKPGKDQMEKLGQEQKDEMALEQFEESLDYHVEKVSLMTLHAAKGLEFPVVFIIGCEARLLPLDLEGFSIDPQEERRLFYVGMTRAKEQLYLTRSGRRQLFGQTLFNAPSMFLADIQEDLKAYENSKLKRRVSRSQESQNQQLKLF